MTIDAKESEPVETDAQFYARKSMLAQQEIARALETLVLHTGLIAEALDELVGKVPRARPRRVKRRRKSRSRLLA